MGNRFQDIMDRVTDHPVKRRCAVVCPDEETLEAALDGAAWSGRTFLFFDESRRNVMDGLSALHTRADACIVVETPEAAAEKRNVFAVKRWTYC